MTREDFIKKIEHRNNRGLSHQEIDGGRIVVTGEGTCVIGGHSIPSGTIFNNVGSVDMSILDVPEGVEFINRRKPGTGTAKIDAYGQHIDNGDVNIPFITSIGDNVKFENSGDLCIGSDLRKISKSVEFNNGGDIYVGVDWSMIGNWSSHVELKEWIPSIEGIDAKRLFNFMIKKGLFI